MRIFMALANSPNPTFASNLWKWNLHDPLVEMGHDVVLWDGGIQPLFDVDPASLTAVPLRATFTERFLAAVDAAHRASPLDLVLTYVSDTHLEPAAIDRVRERVAPILNFFCNNVHQFHLVRRNARHYSACLVPEAEALPHYRKAGADPIFFPMAANPTQYRPRDVPMDLDASFAGQRYADRATLTLALREHGVDAQAFGQGWVAEPPAPPSPGAPNGAQTAGVMRVLELIRTGRSPLRAAQDRRDLARLRAGHAAALHPPVSDDGYVELFSRSRISLGFLIVGDTHRTLRPQRQVRLREFEATMSGAFYVTGWMEEMELHYEVGREIVCYRSADELVDRCRWYLRHDAERERIRMAGLARARRDHTWTRRFTDLFAELTRRGWIGVTVG